MGHHVTRDQAVVVALSLGHGEPADDAGYRILAPDPGGTFQTGRSDARGRVTFLPDRPGRWRVMLTNDDGHGVEVKIDIDDQIQLSGVAGPAQGGFGTALAAAGYLLGLAGALILWRRRRHAVSDRG
ncbi:MAG: hypothetical protein RQ741_00555 [Wenzhouxiangellaceae bacterium]|nr:hypothetical protein [Wenzhouxiangellaceae bacterium]